MKLIPKLALLNLLCFTVFPVAADNAQTLAAQQQTSTSLEEIAKYLKNLGAYLGYDVEQSPTNEISQTLLPVTQSAQSALFYTVLGAISVNSAEIKAFTQFVPSYISGADNLNRLENITFAQQNYSTPSKTEVSISNLIDQKEYQPDPISQGVLNILSTPDSSYCPNGLTDCEFLVNTMVPINVIGPIPEPKSFFTYAHIGKFLSQLNSNSLIGPLLYSPAETQENNTSKGVNAGLSAGSQAQQAANFIRYVSGGVTPIKLPKWKDYDNLYTQAIASDNNTLVTPIQKQKAQATLSKYLADLRTYAAQNSVGLSNLYYIMSKRLPQANPNSTEQETPMSQALSEFNMATKRLLSPNGSSPGNTEWIKQLQTASPATVEKEIAILLAEINYQMYLDRQLNERLLLTNSIQLLQNLHTNEPSTTDLTSGD
ncbi:MAG: phosphoesterase [Legionella longbeachae]|nr:phosphoesterase [Legionella longbeachae]